MTDVVATPHPTTIGEAGQEAVSAAVGILSSPAVTRRGPATTEFWATVLGPVVTFVVTYVAAWAVAHNVTTSDVASVIVPAASAAVTGTASAWAVKGYAEGRAELKKVLATVEHAPAAGTPRS